MARDTLALQVCGAEGAQKAQDLTMADFVAANDFEFVNDGKTILVINNAGSGSQAADVISVADSAGRLQDLTVTTTNGKISIAGPFNPSLWNQADGKVHIDASVEDNFEFAAVQLKAL